jgi:heat shock protein HslJ
MRFAALVLLLPCLASPCGATDLVQSPLAGANWLVAAIDGEPLEAPPSDDNRARLPGFGFGWRTYGGNVGCNQLGGLYAQVYERFYTMPGPQTAMACGGARAAQEAAANALFAASPTVTRTGDVAVLSGGGHRMELKRLGPAPLNEPPAALEAAAVSGQTFLIHSVNGQPTNGKRLWSKNPPQLALGTTTLAMRLDCPGSSTSAFSPGTEHLFVQRIEPPCAIAGTRDAQFAAILNDHPRTVPGPNGELLLASRAGWAILWNQRRNRPK